MYPEYKVEAMEWDEGKQEGRSGHHVFPFNF